MNKQQTKAPEQLRRPRRKSRKKRRSPLPLILTAVVTLFAFWKLTTELIDQYQSRKHLDELKAQVVRENAQHSEEGALPTQPVEFAPIQVDFLELMRYYPDVVGWLYCPGTSINYPVVQTDNNQYYMHRLPNGNESAGGSLFVDCTNTWGFSDTNTIIYGHDMKDGSMFGYLHNYDSQSYYENHPVLYLLTPGCNYRMDIVCTAVIPSDSWLYEKQMEGEQLRSWIDEATRISLIRPAAQMDLESAHFLTLSTCSYEYENARFVVIGSLNQIY